MDPAALLPLKPELFQILLTLLDAESHGYAIMQGIADRTGGEVRILPGALYRHLHRMLDNGLIEEGSRRELGGSTDERRRYYSVSEFGRRVAEAEAARLARLVDHARSRNLLREEGPS